MTPDQPTALVEHRPVRPTERGLLHGASDAAFGAAMMRCRNSSGDCSYAGRCIMGGCFSSGPEIDAARLIEVLIPTDGRTGVEYAYVRAAAQMLRAGRIDL